MTDKTVVNFEREEGSDNFDFLMLLHEHQMKLSLFDERLLSPLSNDGDSGLNREHLKLTDYFIPQKNEIEHFCQIKCLEMPDGKLCLSFIPIVNDELDPFCVGLIECPDMDSQNIIRTLEAKLTYINHYLNGEIWEYETLDGDYSSDVCGGFLSMEEAIDYFFQFNKIQDFTIICDGSDQTEFFHKQARRAELKKTLSEYLSADVVNGILNSIPDQDIEKIANRHAEDKEQKEEHLRTLHQ